MQGAPEPKVPRAILLQGRKQRRGSRISGPAGRASRRTVYAAPVPAPHLGAREGSYPGRGRVSRPSLRVIGAD
jgi:hypothetical protein